jgi:hypothetical protein
MLRSHEQAEPQFGVRPSAVFESGDESPRSKDDPFDWRPTISIHAASGLITDLQSGAAMLGVAAVVFVP